MNDEITIVSAFYDIGRAGIKGAQRDFRKYFEYFSFWAGLKNELVVFTSEEFRDEILAIRANLGFADRTKVVVRDLASFDEGTLAKMREVLAKFDQSKGRANPQNIECVSVEYDFLMYAKPFFVCEALNLGLAGERTLWLDFGFNHGGSFFTDKAQFTFTLVPQSYAQLDEGKINFFSLKDSEKAHIAELYYTMRPYLMGGLIYGGRAAWAKFRADINEAMRAFLSFGIIDDDQILLLWCARNRPQNCHIVRTADWFDSLSFFIPPEIRHQLAHREILANKAYKKHKAQMKEFWGDKNYLKALVCGAKYVAAKLRGV